MSTNWGPLFAKMMGRHWRRKRKGSRKDKLSDGEKGSEKQSSNDLWLITEDYTATSEKEVSVSRGQQVELVESAAGGSPEWCLVRLPSVETNSAPTEGLVPAAMLKQVPNLKVSASRGSIENEGDTPAASGDPSPNTSTYSLASSNSAASSSPANKRRSSFRKWLTNPVRKLSQSKLDKSGSEKNSQENSSKSAKGQKGKFSTFKEIESTPDAGRGPASSSVEPAHTAPPARGALTAESDLEDDESDFPEVPPSMDPLPSIPVTQPASPPPVSQTDVDIQMSSQTSTEGQSQMDLAQEIQSIVEQRMQNESQSSDNKEPSPEPEQSTEEQSTENAEGGQEEGQDVDSTKAIEDEGPQLDEKGEVLSEEEANRRKYMQKRQYVIQELIDTETDYVRDLGLIVEGYMVLVKENEPESPPEFEGKDKIVWGNIHQIYDWHKETFQKELNKCASEPERIGGVFVRYERRLYMYVKYCENKPKSEFLVAEYFDYFEDLRAKLGHKLQIPDLLIKPVQRIMKYQLLLKDILKYTDKAGDDTKDLQRAVEVMCVVPKAANDMMNAGRLQGFNGKLTAQGKLLLQGTIAVKEITSKMKADKQAFADRRVFLFEQMIIISEEVERKKNSLTPPHYIFKNSIKVNKMSIKEKSEDGPLCFVLKDKTPGSDLELICQAADEETKQNWVAQVQALLRMQGDFLMALQSPIAYQKELTKELSAPEFGSLQRNSMLRKTHSQPQPTKTQTLPQPKSSTSDKKQKQDAKHSRTKSVPSPVHAASADAKKEQDSSLKEPSSPTGKDSSEKRGPSAGTSSGGSPKPKRNFLEGFKNTLRPKKSLGSDSNSKSAKDKGDSSSSGLSPSSEQYANPQVSEGVQDADTKASASGGSSVVNNTQIVS